MLNQAVRQDYRNMLFIFREEVPDSDFNSQNVAMLKATQVNSCNLPSPYVIVDIQSEDIIRIFHEKRKSGIIIYQYIYVTLYVEYMLWCII